MNSFSLILTTILVCLGILCEKCTSSSVIIIGAGPAGIAAATKLLENGITNITILEAENRIGGRIHSVKFGDAFVDVGAEFIHGQENNLVYEIAEKLGLVGHSNVLDQPFAMYLSNGTRLDDELTKEFQNISFGFEEAEVNKTGLSLGELFLQQFNSTLLSKYQNDTNKLAILRNSLPLAQHIVNSPEGSFSWFDPTTESHYQECEGDQTMTWKGRGYKTILEILMKSYPDPTKKLNIDDKILLNKVVTKIDWSSGDSVEVSTSDESKYKADHVIFTPSVGVLKEQHEKLFHPKLSNAKQKAIEETGFDGVMKIILHFPTKWWNDEDEFIAFIWDEESLKDLEQQFGVNSTWIASISVFVKASANPKVRVGWVSGKEVKEIEVLPIETVKKGINYILHKFLGKDYNVVEPDQILRSTWCTNPNFRGTYSFEKAKYFKPEVSNQKILAEPLNNEKGQPVILFAGEATNPIHYSTVHGAIETGYREADRLIALLSTKD